MDFFMAYLKSKKKVFWLLIIFALTYFCVFLLYQLPLTLCIYPTCLCCGLAIAFFIPDFLKSRRRHLRFLQDCPDYAIRSEAGSVEEADCLAKIETLEKQIAEIETKWSGKYRDTVEYYTVWVHQIKTPIASMRLRLQGEDSAQARQLLSELSRIEQYVEMVLVFLRLGTDSTDYVLKEHSVESLAKQAVRRFASDFIGRKLSLSFEPFTMTAITDEKWFVFCLEQLISNALKYTREGGVKIYSPSDKVLCIEDTGIGIAPEDLPRIFEKGYTGYNGHQDKKASGIGLYLCKRILEKLYIDIRMESEPGKGTKVFLDLSQYDLKAE